METFSSTLPATTGNRSVEPQATPFQIEINLKQVQRQIDNRLAILDFVKTALVEGVHYGRIEGCGDKPTLLQPGADMICSLFGAYADTEYNVKELGGQHREYIAMTILRHIGTDVVLGKGTGSCSTMESKYRYRSAARVCPECGKSAIIAGKKEYGGGWICFAKKGGCGAKWKAGAPEIEQQQQGQIDNQDLADVYNTCLKIAGKRSKVAAALSLSGGWSEHFTQDLEDLRQNESARRGADPESDSAPPAGMDKPKPEPASAVAAEYPEHRTQATALVETLIDEAGVRDTDEQKPLVEMCRKIWKEMTHNTGLPDNPAFIPPVRWPAVFEQWASRCRAELDKRRAKAGLPTEPKSHQDLLDAKVTELLELPHVKAMGEQSFQFMDNCWSQACQDLHYSTHEANSLSQGEFSDAVTAMVRIVEHAAPKSKKKAA